MCEHSVMFFFLIWFLQDTSFFNVEVPKRSAKHLHYLEKLSEQISILKTITSCCTFTQFSQNHEIIEALAIHLLIYFFLLTVDLISEITCIKV